MRFPKVMVNEMLLGHWMAFTDILNAAGGLSMLTEVDKEREFRRRRGAKIEKAMINLSWTRAQLAAKSGRDIRVIRDLINGEPTVQAQSIQDICQALKIEPELYPSTPAVEVADLKYGAYARHPYKHYEGAFFAYRRSFSVPDLLVRSIFEIRWDDALRLLAFREILPDQVNTTKTIDGGEIYISQNTDLVHLMTVIEGSVRTIMLRKMREGIMRGCILWQTDRETYFQPAFSAIFLEKLFGFEFESHKQLVGLMRSDDPDYDRVSNEIVLIEKKVIAVATFA
jgi:hypothetical protein